MVSSERVLPLAQVDQVHDTDDGGLRVLVLPLVDDLQDAFHDVLQLFGVRGYILVATDVYDDCEYPVDDVCVMVFQQYLQTTQDQWVTDTLIQIWVSGQVCYRSHCFNQYMFVLIRQIYFKRIYNPYSSI